MAAWNNLSGLLLDWGTILSDLNQLFIWGQIRRESKKEYMSTHGHIHTETIYTLYTDFVI